MKKHIFILTLVLTAINVGLAATSLHTVAETHKIKTTIEQSWKDSGLTTYRACTPKTEPGKLRDVQQKQIYNDALAMQGLENEPTSDAYKAAQEKYQVDVEKYDTCTDQNI